MEKLKSWRGRLRRVTVRYQYLLRLVITIFVGLYIPVVLSQYMMTRNAYEQLRETAVAEYAAVPERFGEGFYEVLSRVEALSYEVRRDYREREDHRLTREAVEGHPYGRVQMVAILGDYLRMLPDAEVVGVHFYNTDYVVTSGASYTISQYAGRLTGYRGNLMTVFEDRLRLAFSDSSQEGMRIVSTFPDLGARSGTFILARPVAINAGTGTTADAVMLFEFSASSFDGLVGTNYSGENCGLAIFSGTELLFCNESFDEGLLSDAAFLAYLAGSDGEMYSCGTDGDTANVFKTTDSSMGLTFVTVFPESMMFRGVDGLYEKMNFILLCVVAGFILIAAAAVAFMYHPVKRLMKEVRPEEGEETGGGEFSAVESTLETMRTENTQMREAVAEQKLWLMDYIFGSMLHGMKTKPTVLRQLGASFDYRCYIVAVIGSVTLNTAQREEITRSLEAMSGASVFMTDLQNEDYLILVFAGDDRLCGEDALPAETERRFAELLGKTPECGFGGAVTSIEALRGSYREALLRMRERRRESGGTLRERAGAELAAFLQAVQDGRREALPGLLDELFEASVESCQDMFQRRFFCYEILESYLELLQRLNIRRDKGQFDRVISFFSEEELRHVLEEDAATVCEEMKQHTEKNDSRQREQFISYVERHFADPELTLTEMADAFGMSVYTCSRLFKDLVGIGFKEYTVARRLEYAKELLISTELSIGEIGERCGFSSTSYFISRFKSVYGVPPNKFRTVE